jgi:hypothetical protein
LDSFFFGFLKPALENLVMHDPWTFNLASENSIVHDINCI